MSFIRKYRIGGKIYLAEVESRRVKGKVVQRFIRYVGKQADGKTILSTSISDVSVSEVRLYGPLLVLHHLAREIGLPEHLGPYANEILSMVYAHCLDYRSLNHMRRWFARTDLSWILQLEQLTEERLVRAMDFLEQTDGEKLQRTIFDSVKQRYHLKASGVIYDVTNTYLYGKKCPFAQFGHDKEGVRGRPLIQIGLAVTLEEGIPLFHKVFDGNISDSRTLHDLITTFASYGLRPGTILCDRGITSARNVKDMKNLGWNTIGGLPLTPPLQKFCRPLLAKASDLHYANRVELKETPSMSPPTPIGWERCLAPCTCASTPISGSICKTGAGGKSPRRSNACARARPSSPVWRNSSMPGAKCVFRPCDKPRSLRATPVFSPWTRCRKANWYRSILTRTWWKKLFTRSRAWSSCGRYDTGWQSV